MHGGIPDETQMMSKRSMYPAAFNAHLKALSFIVI